MIPSLSARLLAQSLLAIACGSVACSDDGDGAGNQGNLIGSTGPGGAAGASGSAGTAGASGTAGAAGVAGNPSWTCLTPTPVLVEGVPTGYVQCADGGLARTGAAACKLSENVTKLACPAPTDPPTPLGPYDRCGQACTDGAHGVPFANGTPAFTYCTYYCETDADCPSQQQCACDGDGVGRCAFTECGQNGDCPTGEVCRVATEQNVCTADDSPRLFCMGASDACLSDADCAGNPAGTNCLSMPLPTGGDGEGPRTCGQGPICGRPIFVEEAARVALLVRSSSWS